MAHEAGTDFSKYLNMKGWLGFNNFVAPQGIKIGVPDDELIMWGITLSATYDGKLTVKVGVAEDNTITGKNLSAQALMTPPFRKVKTYKSIEDNSLLLTNLRANGHYSYRVKATTLYDVTEWSEPKEVRLASPVSIADIQNTPAQPRTIYNLQGQRLSKPQRGINIIDGKKVMY